MEYDDLKKLVDEEVSEGWFIEYKEAFPNKNYKIANSIASFANSEGGWYIVGIKEKENQSNPSEIIGFSLDDHNKPTDKITNIIKDSISPIPFFKSKIIKIPSSDKVVLVVFIPEGNNPPYISKGSVYKRVGETSKPLAITDRYEYDKLIIKGDIFKQEMEVFSENKFTTSKAQKNSNQPYLECFIYLDNHNENLFDDFYSKEFFEKVHKNFNSEVNIISKDLNISPSINFSNHYSSIESHIIRYIGNNNSFDLGLTLELFHQGHFKLILPFNIYSVNNLNENYDNLNSYENLFSDDEKEFLRVIDGAESIISISIILEQYKRLLDEYGFDYNLYIKLNFKNFWRVTPYFDDENFLDYIRDYGLPINLKDELEVPLNGKYIFLNFEEFNINEIFMIFINALGFPFHLKESIARGFSKYVMSFVED